MRRRVPFVLPLFATMATWAGVPVISSFKTAEEVVRYFGPGVPVTSPRDSGRFGFCYRSPDGVPPMAVYFEFEGKGLADGKQSSTYYLDVGKTMSSDKFGAYQMKCAVSPRATPEGVAQRSRYDSFRTMGEVFRYLGPAPIAKHPRDADLFAVCYASPQGSPPHYVVIEAKGMDIDTARVRGGMQAPGSRPKTPDLGYKNYRFECAESPKVNPDLWTAF